MNKPTNHTPGPWTIGKARFSRERGSALEGEVTRLFMPGAVEVLVVSLGASEEQVEADARLIAAAPDTAAERDKLKDAGIELMKALAEVEELYAPQVTGPNGECPGLTRGEMAIINARAAMAKYKDLFEPPVATRRMKP